MSEDLKLNDLSLTEIIQGTTLAIIEHLACLRKDKEIRINDSGVWCDCEPFDEKFGGHCLDLFNIFSDFRIGAFNAHIGSLAGKTLTLYHIFKLVAV